VSGYWLVWVDFGPIPLTMLPQTRLFKVVYRREAPTIAEDSSPGFMLIQFYHFQKIRVLVYYPTRQKNSISFLFQAENKTCISGLLIM